MDQAQPRRRKRTEPITLRLRSDLIAAVPVEPAHHAGRRGAGVRGFLSGVLEAALVEKYGLPSNEDMAMIEQAA